MDAWLVYATFMGSSVSEKGIKAFCLIHLPSKEIYEGYKIMQNG